MLGSEEGAFSGLLEHASEEPLRVNSSFHLLSLRRIKPHQGSAAVLTLGVITV